ncbi:MAG: hypothetical protein Q8755_02805, partial [Candidatus Phytoplasma australasiaticum]|nr:hypothetical protein [Candidatus Phytoplasma australasiaticum]
MDMGPYITRIATRLGVFEKYKKEFLTEVFPTVSFGVKELRKACIFTYDEPPQWVEPFIGQQVAPPLGTKAAKVMQSAILTQRQPRPLHRRELPAEQHEIRDQPQEPRTLDGLYELVEKRFGQIQRYMEREFKKIRDLLGSGQARD